ncbi:MAG: hypothetical protein OES13_11075 [Acidimicrobiia bacterium]|nr:hypothetical protein [Acidimicrobiia bacterium]
MEDGLLDGLPSNFGEGLVFAGVVAVLVVLWSLVRRTRARHFEDLQRRREGWQPPEEPDDPRDLPPPR